MYIESVSPLFLPLSLPLPLPLLLPPEFFLHPLLHLFYLPKTLTSTALKTKYDTVANENASGNPTSPPPPLTPMRLPMGPVSHAWAMPSTAPAAPTQQAAMAAMLGGRRVGEV